MKGVISMFKVAILGCENSHADGFLKFIKEKSEFSDVEVVGVYSEFSDAAEKLKENYGVSVMENYSDLVGKIDGVIVTARHGGMHYKYVKPYIESGIPVFMDKPITIDPDEAISMMADFKKYNTPFTGGSSLRYAKAVKELKAEALENDGGRTLGGVARAPLHETSEHGGFYFYAQHLVEIVCEIFTRFPESVKAYRSKNGITVIIRYPDYDVTGYFMEENYGYFAARMSEEYTNAQTIIVDDDCFAEEFCHFHRLLHKVSCDVDMKEFIAPVFIMNAIMASLESGKEEKIPWERIENV